MKPVYADVSANTPLGDVRTDAVTWREKPAPWRSGFQPKQTNLLLKSQLLQGFSKITPCSSDALVRRLLSQSFHQVRTFKCIRTYREADPFRQDPVKALLIYLLA